MKCSIKILKNGSIRLKGFEQFYLARTPEYIDAFIYIFLIEYDGKKILIDCGLPKEDYLNEINKKAVEETGDETAKFFQEYDEDILHLIEKEGLKKEEIDYIILTHLHIDHVGGLDLFPNAKMIFSRKGWSYFYSRKYPMTAPRSQIPGYIQKYLLFDAWDRVYLNDEREELLPGISVQWVGGHSMCSQIIKVKTGKKTIIFCGDIVATYRNIENNIPIALLHNLEEVLSAMDIIRSSADLIIPGHDPLLLQKFKNGVII